MCRGPFLRPGAIGTSSPDVEGDDQEEHGEDDEFLVEVGDGDALPDAVPLGVGAAGGSEVDGGGRGGGVGGGSGGDSSVGWCDGRGGGGVVGKVCVVVVSTSICIWIK